VFALHTTSHGTTSSGVVESSDVVRSVNTAYDCLYFANQKAADNIHTQINADRTQTHT